MLIISQQFAPYLPIIILYKFRTFGDSNHELYAWSKFDFSHKRSGSSSKEPGDASPIDAHHHVSDAVKIDGKVEVEENSDPVCHSDFESCDDEEVKLMECDEVVYEKRDGVAGVKFREDGEEGWTPVLRRRPRRQKMGPGRTSGDPGWGDCVFPSGGWDSWALRANQENSELVAYCGTN